MEMNIFLPQSIQAREELRHIAAIDLQFIHPSVSKSSVGIVQDGLIGVYNLTSTEKIDYKNAMNIMAYSSLEDFASFPKDEKVDGSSLYSMVIPNNVNLTASNNLKVKAGVITSGRVTTKNLGFKEKNTLIQLIWDEYGKYETENFIDNTQRIANNYNLWHGFSVGYGDIERPLKLEDQINKIFETKRQEIMHLITDIENNPELMKVESMEKKMYSTLKAVNEEVQKLSLNTLSENNAFKIMALSGSKGKADNVGQMIGSLGLHTFEGKLIPKRYNNRTLPYFHINDDTAESRGLTRKSFIDGLDWPGFIYQMSHGRSGLIDSAVKSVTRETPIIIMEDGETKYVKIGDWIDERLNNNQKEIKHFDQANMELLELKDNTVFIPTCDDNGNTSWGEMTAITRHDPGDNLYEIKTQGGRSVTVAESKSLIVWNGKKFEMKHTPDIKIGDFAPTIMKLTQAPNVNENSNEIKLNTENGIIIGSEIFTKFNGKIPNEVYNAPQEFIDELFNSIVSNYGKNKNDNIEIPMIEGIEILLARLGMYCEINNDTVKILKQNDKNNIKNDVVLDKIVEINKISCDNHPKLYDVTVPSTINFALANGLVVRDTAETGYMQRKLIKSLEDIMIKYDGSCRNTNDRVIQFIYGDSGADTIAQFEYEISVLEMNNEELEKVHKFTSQELKNIDGFSAKDNDKLYNEIKMLRDKVRINVQNAKMDFMSRDINFMLPVNIVRVLEDVKNNSSTKKDLTPQYVINQLNDLLTNEKTPLVTMTKKDRENPNSFKNRDEQAHKTIFKLALYDAFSPKKLIIDYGIDKEKFDKMIETISYNFEKNMIEPGEMVGVIAACATGEPLTQISLNSFHQSGVARMTATTQGVPRMREIFGVTKNLRTPQMIIYMNENVRKKKDVVHKIASNLKYTVFSEVRERINIIYDPKPQIKKGYMKDDNIILRAFTNSKIDYDNENEVQNLIAGLPWLLRIELNREKMAEKEITLLDVVTQFQEWWKQKTTSAREDQKSLKKEEKRVINKITNLTSFTNTDNDKEQIVHIRFNSKDSDKDKFDLNTINDFITFMLDKFKLKGINGISEITAIPNEKIVVFNPDNGNVVTDNEYVIYTHGLNLTEIRYFADIDLSKTISNDIVQVMNVFGLEIAKAVLMKEIATAYSTQGGEVNHQHIKIIVDQMTVSGSINSIDRHGLNKSDATLLSRASFEKPVEQLWNAAMFGESDNCKSVSARIMIGQAIRGGTGYCELLLNTKMFEESEFSENEHDNKYVEITTDNIAADILKKNKKIENKDENDNAENDDDVFMPEA